jgi:diguanylate cyclase (GGDEF)-like protein
MRQIAEIFMQRELIPEQIRPAIHALVVDDGPVERLAGKTMLEKLGFSVTTVASAEDALQHMSECPVDLVLCDIAMPGMSGLTLLQTTRTQYRPPIFIMSTSYDDAEHAVASLRHGASGYLTKPLRFDALRDTVTEAIEKFRLEKNYALRAAQLVEQDALTGLMNKGEFMHRLQARLRTLQPGSASGAIMLLKIRGLSSINHSYGRMSGDRVLQLAAKALSQELRASDLIGRIGGDLFAVYLNSIPHVKAESRATSIVENAEAEKIVLGTDAFSLSLVAGVACADSGMELDELVNRADFALHIARERGRSRIRFYSAADEVHKAELSHQLNTLALVRAALADSKRMEMHYQPIIDLDTGCISHFEALLRVVDEHGKPCATGELVKTCEVFGLIGQLDRAVVKACLAGMFRLPQDTGVAINLSGKSIGDPDLLQLIETQIAAHGIDPARIIFELTETAAFYNIDEVRHFVRCIKGLGCRFALDDFGVGFSSFYYIRELEFDYLKIDGSFIANLRSNRNDQAFVRAMVEISRVFGLSVIAEWVEDRETAAMLRDFGVNFGQGYYFGKATSLSA